MSNPYETKAFKNLLNHWSQILKADGFVDHEMGGYLRPDFHVQRELAKKEKEENPDDMIALLYTPWRDDIVKCGGIKVQRSVLRNLLKLFLAKAGMRQMMDETGLTRYKIRRITNHADRVLAPRISKLLK